jgi:hypothetical protein
MFWLGGEIWTFWGPADTTTDSATGYGKWFFHFFAPLEPYCWYKLLGNKYFAIMQHFSDCDGNAIFGISSNKSQSGPIIIKIRRNLTWVRPVHSFHLLGWGSTSYSPWGALKNYSYLFRPSPYMRVREIQIGERKGEANKRNEPKCT